MTLFAAVGRTFSVRNIRPFLPLLVYVAATFLIAATFFYSFRQIEELIQQEKLHDLGAIADMKAAQIAAWRDTQKRIAEAFACDSAAAEFQEWLEEGAPANRRRQKLQQELAELQYVNGFKNLALIDRRGAVRLSLDGRSAIAAEEARLAVNAMDSGEARFSDFHRNSFGDRGISIDLIAPLIAGGRDSGRVVGAVLLQMDPYADLYPLIRSWPVHSASAETLLVRQEGNDVLFLNDVRHKKGTALTLRLPLDTPTLAAAMALRDKASSAVGIDYRGVPVVFEMRQVAGTPWFVVSKIDREELLAPVTRLKQWSAGLGTAYAGIGGLLVFVWLQGYRARYRHLKEQHAAAVEREMLTKHFEYLTKYANDIILVAGEDGGLVEANERAQQAYGYSRDELLRMHIRDLCDPSHDPNTCWVRIEQFNDQGESRFETVNLRRDGSVFPVEVSARVIAMEGVRYSQFIVRDISERKRAENALRKSEILLKESQQMAHIGSWEMDLTNNILYWSDENYRIFEIDPARFGASYEAFLGAVHPDDRELVNRAYTDSVGNRTPYSVVHRLLLPGQRVKFVREWCETYYDEEGSPLRSIGTTQDITEQQLAQNELRASARQIEDLYNRAPCGYHSLDRNGVIVQINDTELQWLGHAREEVIGKMNFTQLLTPASLEVFRSNYPGFKQRGYVHDLEYELVRKDGTTFFVSLSATAVTDAEGQYLMSRSTLFDISARKLVEKKLEESEERFRTMADHAPILIWMADALDKPGYQGCNFFNQRWHDFTGLPLERTQGREWLDIVHPDDSERCLDTYLEAFRTMSPFKLEYRLRRHDGAFRWVQDSGVPRFTEEGRFLGFIGTCLDITEHKLFEEVREEMEHVGRLNIAGEMASSLAHELSQPLSAANNYLDACLRRMEGSNWDRDSLQKAVRQAHVQTGRAGAIISHLKSLVRKQKQERSMLEINSLISDTVSFMDYELHHHFIKLSLELSAVPPVLANRIEVEQVLINLIKNAIDSMDSSRRRELRITSRVTESGAIMVSVSDTGKGIAADELENIFNPFQTSKKEGLGLGLPICRSVVENYGGQIWAEQNGDGGAEFNFTLPAWGGL